jgi:phage gp29-like protein
MASNKPDFREIATTQDGRDITRGYIPQDFLLLPQDTVLSLQGGNYEIYKDVLKDDQVGACFQQRRTALISKEWVVNPASEKRLDKKAADFIKETLKNIQFDQTIDKMLYGIFYGYSVAECLWAKDGSYVTLGAIKVRDRRRFAFDGQFRLRLLTTFNPNGELLPERKFWTYCTGADHDDEPYGLGLAHWLYWPVFFKKNGLKFWLIFLEKFGMPTSKGTYDSRATEEERAKLLEAVQAIQTDSGIILPEGMSIELIEAARSGTADYSTLFTQMQSIIAKVILSQTMTTDNGSSYSQSKVHEGVADAVIKSDADLTHGSFNQAVVKWLVDWNFPGAAYPTVWRELEGDEDLGLRAERESKIFAMGFKPTLKHVQDVYGGEWELTPPLSPLLSKEGTGVVDSRLRGNDEEGNDEEGNDKEGNDEEGKNPEFSEKKPSFPRKRESTEDEIDGLTHQAVGNWQQQMSPVIQPLLKTCQDCTSYADFLEKLNDPTLLEQMDTTKFEQEMGNALFLTYLYGRVTNA